MSQNQCDGCHAGIPVDANGNHRMGKPGGYADLMKCQADRYASNDSDFASLLEREPREERMSERERCAHELEEYGYPNAARILRNGPDSLDERLKADSQTNSLDSAAARIKSLEDVLVAIRVKAASGVGASMAHRGASERADVRLTILTEIASLVSETLDPCKPWCVLAEEGRKHEGACVPADEGRDQ